jgi:hypothetical protein
MWTRRENEPFERARVATECATKALPTNGGEIR